jgi:hypothetical protein
MTWFKDNRGHILESRVSFRLIQCDLCNRLVSKQSCVKMRQSRITGALYPVKKYSYPKPASKLAEAEIEISGGVIKPRNKNYKQLFSAD